MKFAGGNNYYRNWSMKKGAGYERKFASSSIGLVAMSIRC